jgi:radical SAM protein with 4Fe4S-binding SPASM domain
VAPFRPWLYVTGGEPLIYPDFQGFVQEARRRGLAVQIQTNGTLLASVAEFLVQAGVVAVSVSLDGPPEVHDAIRGVKGAYGKLAAGAAALVAARRKCHSPTPILGLNCTISKGNLDFLPEVVSQAIELQADTLQLQHTMFNSPEKVARHNAFFTPARVRELGLDMVFPSICEGEYYQSEIGPEDLPRLKSGLRQARVLAKDRIKLLSMPNLPDELLDPYYLDLDYSFQEGCDFFWKTFRISPDGTYSPCLNLKIGNIAQEPFTEIWNGPKMRALRRLFAHHLFPGCVRCCQRHYVKGSRAF